MAFRFLCLLTLGFKFPTEERQDTTSVGENPKGKKEIWESREMS